MAKVLRRRPPLRRPKPLPGREEEKFGMCISFFSALEEAGREGDASIPLPVGEPESFHASLQGWKGSKLRKVPRGGMPAADLPAAPTAGISMTPGSAGLLIAVTAPSPGTINCG